MDHELQKDQKVDQEIALVKTLPELADISETIKRDKEVKREVGVVMNEDIADNKNIAKEIKEMENQERSVDKKLSFEEAIETIRETMIEEADSNQDEDDQEGEKYYLDDECESPPKRIKIEINWNDIHGEGKGLLSSDRVQTLLQPTSSSSIVTDVVESMTMPGFNNNVVNALHISFWLLFIVLIILAVVTDHHYIVLINIGTSFMLYIGMIWFIVYIRASQIEEAALAAKKED
ncbi:11635_t:CDS:2 [Funneliformis geosporum]|uniref:11635_t:CDS:1 n=1 Tax=Funneliformis geosporum TaxID=1117311 RepID=A0A9W4WW99_9GLOM|nr:11635_t:CDS:2 [Funneliformis geosporum]